LAEYLHRELTGAIIEDAIRLHRELGPGVLESAYEACLAHLLIKRGLRVDQQKPMPVRFDGVALDVGYRADLIVEGVVLVELKAVQQMEAIFEAQMLTYLKLSGIRVGLLINFHEMRLRDGVKRLVI